MHAEQPASIIQEALRVRHSDTVRSIPDLEVGVEEPEAEEDGHKSAQRKRRHGTCHVTHKLHARGLL